MQAQRPPDAGKTTPDAGKATPDAASDSGSPKCDTQKCCKVLAGDDKSGKGCGCVIDTVLISLCDGLQVELGL